MMIRIFRNENEAALAPLCEKRTLQEMELCGTTFGEMLLNRWEKAIRDFMSMKMLSAASAFWPSEKLLADLKELDCEFAVTGPDGALLAWLADSEDPSPDAVRIPLDAESVLIRYPWDLLGIHERELSGIKESEIKGIVRNGATVDGILILGEGSVVLPGVYIEGTAVVGKNCKIGPNAYLRGNCSIGDNCHIGQAVEIKNSILMTHVAAGHLSYIGDTIVCRNVNFGAGTITSNFRHDGKNHRSMVNGELLDTGRRKFGSIIGENVHTGIHTSIYPGRKIQADVSTRPGTIVKNDLME